ncbi:hypothetical protein HKW82_28655, partial [Pseudomonas aeruginosa]|nr:hypothetical protein [Pseudomonas aeruginosa]
DADGGRELGIGAPERTRLLGTGNRQAIERGLAHQALKRLSEGKIKGRSFKVRLL